MTSHEYVDKEHKIYTDSIIKFFMVGFRYSQHLATFSKIL